MAGETEIDRLVVRLFGDQEDYQKFLGDAVHSTQETAHQLESIHVAEGILGAHAIEAAGHAILETVHEITHAWEEQEAANIALEATLKAHGRDVEELFGVYSDWATHIQATTTLADEQALMLVKSAESFDLTGEAAKGAAEDAIALGAATGNSAQMMMRLTAAVAEGNIERARLFSRYVPELRRVKDDTEFLAKYQNLVNAGFEVSAKQTATATGQWKQLDNEINNLYEDFGRMKDEMILPFIKAVRLGVAWLQSLSDETKKWIFIVATATALTAFSSLALGIARAIPFVNLFGIALRAALSIIPLIFTPIGLVITAVVALGYAFFNFTEAGKAVVEWFGTQFQKIADYVGPALQGVKDAMIAGDMKLAGEIMFKQLEIAWMDGVLKLMKIWTDFKVWLGIANAQQQKMMEMAAAMGSAGLQAQLNEMLEKAKEEREHAEKAGNYIGSGIGKGIKDGMKFEQVGAFSAEAFNRLLNQLDDFGVKAKAKGREAGNAVRDVSKGKREPTEEELARRQGIESLTKWEEAKRDEMWRRSGKGLRSLPIVEPGDPSKIGPSDKFRYKKMPWEEGYKTVPDLTKPPKELTVLESIRDSLLKLVIASEKESERDILEIDSANIA